MATGYRGRGAGDTPAQIAKCLNCQRLECVNCLAYETDYEEEHELTPREKAKKKRALRAKELHEKGFETHEIAKVLGVNCNSVRSYLRALGVPNPTGPIPKLERRAQVEELIKQGMNQCEVARTLGINRATVYYHLQRIKAERGEL